MPTVATLGFGCAGLYGVPSARHRRALLESAYEMGIRHFDVAPTYGLGIAERELADFLRNRADATVATKFGLRPSLPGRMAGTVQRPVRRTLALLPGVQRKMRGTTRRRDAGVLDHVLYTGRDYSVTAARQSLGASLRALRVGHIDYFMLHEPAGCLAVDDELIEFLEHSRRDGLIGRWGPAGDLSQVDPGLTHLSNRASAHQFPYDLIRGAGGRAAGPHVVTYGFVSTALHRVYRMLTEKPDLTRQCSDLLDADLTDKRILIRLLTRDAVLNNGAGIVLASTTKVDNLRLLCEAAGTPLPNEAEAITLIRRRCRP